MLFGAELVIEARATQVAGPREVFLDYDPVLYQPDLPERPAGENALRSYKESFDDPNAASAR
jgi:hypothetical protein